MGDFFDVGGGIHKITDPGDFMGSQAAASAQETSRYLGERTLSMQEDWLNYIKGQFEPYSQVGQRALLNQEGMINSLLAGPNYSAAANSPEYKIMENQARNALLASAEATGGLGSTSTGNALGANAANILGQVANQQYQRLGAGFDALGALSGRGIQGSQGLGQFGGDTISGMAGTLSGIGTSALNSAAMQQQKGAGILGAVASFFSDIRLKKNIKSTGEKTEKGHEIYTWEWNEDAEKLGLKGSDRGVIADHVEMKDPSMVSIDKSGYKVVNYAGL